VHRPSSARWRNTFFVGVIGLNVMVFFREPARAGGSALYLLWSAVVLAIGAAMLLSIYRLRQLRLVDAARRPLQPPEPAPPAPRPRAARAGRKRRRRSKGA
jgi:hypothetical protein